jgi:hypothetical protein
MARYGRNVNLGQGYGSYPYPYSGSGQNTVYDGFQPTIFAPEFVGQPVNDYRQFLTKMSERNQSVADTLDYLDIALSNINVREEDAPLLSQAKNGLTESINDLSNANDYSKVDALIRKTYKDFASNQGLTLAQKAKVEEEGHKKTLQTQVGKKGFTTEMLQNAMLLSKGQSSAITLDPKSGIYSGGFNPYNPAEYVDIGEILEKFGSGWKADAYKAMGAEVDTEGKYAAPGEMIVKRGTEWQRVLPEDLTKYMNIIVGENREIQEYLSDRFKLTTAGKLNLDSADVKVAEELYKNGVLSNYVNAYANKFAFDNTASEFDMGNNATYQTKLREALEGQGQPVDPVYENEPTVKLDEVIQNTIADVSEYFDASGKIKAKREASSGRSGYGSSSVEIPSVSYTLDEVPDNARQMIVDIGKMYGIAKKFEQFSDKDRATVMKHIARIESISPEARVVSDKVDISVGPALYAIANNMFSEKKGAKEEDYTRKSTTDKTLPMNYRSKYFYDLEEGKMYAGNSEDFADDVLYNIKEGDMVSLEGLYNYGNTIPLMTGNANFADASRIKIGNKWYAVTNALSDKTPNRILYNTLSLAEMTKEHGAYPINMTVPNKNGAEIRVVGSIYYSDSTFKYTDTQDEVVAEAPNIAELYKAIKELPASSK